MGSTLLPPVLPRSRLVPAGLQSRKPSAGALFWRWSLRSSIPASGRPRLSSGRALVWGLAYFLGIQLVLTVCMETVHPEWRDPEFGNKLARLRRLRAEYPNRPLLLILGSSRASLGLAPEQLGTDLSARGQAPLVFNFGLTSSGPVQELVCFRRLLAEGIRPAWVVAEVLPPLLSVEAGQDSGAWMPVNRLGWPDLAVLGRYCQCPALLYGEWVQSRMASCYANRFGMLNYLARSWLTCDPQQMGWAGGTRFGWVPYGGATVEVEEYRRGVAWAREQYFPQLQNFHICANPDRAVRELIGLCREHEIPIALFLMPEGRTFQSWYPPAARKQLNAFLAALRRQWGLPIADTRNWMADADFVDSHHLTRQGAGAFTKRFEREVLHALLTGQPCPALAAAR
jgi:hypothetical protein